MLNKVIKIFEHEKKAIGLNENEINLSLKEVSALEKINRVIKERSGKPFDILTFSYYNNCPKFIKTSSFVGILRFGNKSLQIIPKMAKIENDEHSREAVSNLLYMLSYTKKLKIKNSEIASLSKNNDSFFEILIYLFASNLLGLIKNDFNKEYVSIEDSLPFIKGKIKFSSHLKLNQAKKNRFYLEFDDFCEDNLLNRIFKHAISLLLRETTTFNNQKLLQELTFIFSDVSNQSIRPEDFNMIHLNRLNQKYEPVLNLAKIFICQSSLELNVDKIKTFSFLFDMNELFEEFIGEFVKRNPLCEHEKISLQRPTRWLVDEKFVGDDPKGHVFQLRPDIQLFSKIADKEPAIIVDTKYKLLSDDGDKKEGVAQSDLYQMNAYSKKFKCQNIILLYPQLFDQGSKDVKFVIDSNTNVFVRTINLCQNLQLNKKEFAEEIKQALTVKTIRIN